MSVRASIVVVARNGWKVTRDCLTCLAETIRTGDELIVVDDATTDNTRHELGRRRDVTVLRNDRQLGWAASTHVGLTAATHTVVVLLDPATLPTGAWLDLLIEPLDHGSTSSGYDAVSAMSNHGMPAQQWPSSVPYLADGMRGLRAFADGLATDSVGQLLPITAIDPFCIAVTTDHARLLVAELSSDTTPTCRVAVRTNAFVHRVGSTKAADVPARPTPVPAIDLSRLGGDQARSSERPDIARSPALVSIRSVAVVGRAVADLLAAFGSHDVAVVELSDPTEIANRDDIDVIVLTDVDAGVSPPRWALNANAITVALGSDDNSRPTWCDHAAERDVAISDLIDVIEQVDSFGGALVQARQRLESGEVIEAIDALTRAEGQRPDSPQVANCLGVCAYLLGDVDAARHSFQRAIQLDPAYQPAIDNLGGLR